MQITKSPDVGKYTKHWRSGKKDRSPIIPKMLAGSPWQVTFIKSIWNTFRRKAHLQENCNTPLERTPGNPPSQLWKESLHSLLVKGLGVCSKGVLKQPLNIFQCQKKQQIYNPSGSKDTFVCPKNPGFPRSKNPMTWGMGFFNHQSYSIGSQSGEDWILRE